jgi:predicted NUDIX family NTP pyrophosphohydrolase
VVVAQQRDEAATTFSERVRQRARRLSKEDARIESIDVYAAPHKNDETALARRSAIEELGVELADGGRLTLWSADQRGDEELTAILADLGPLLAQRQIAMNHQSCDTEERSGVRHIAPTRSPESEDEFDFEDLG